MTQNEDCATKEKKKILVYNNLAIIFQDHGFDCTCRFCEIFSSVLKEINKGWLL